MRIHFLMLCFVALSLSSLSAATAELPPPPSGYTWAEFKEIKGAFLKPEGWFLKKTGQAGGTLAYFISKEAIAAKGSFQTGLSINVLPHVSKGSGVSAVEYAARYIETARSGKRVVLAPWARDMGPFKSFGVRIHHEDAIGGDYITHHLAIGNAETDTLYLMTFESPSASWDASWKVGENMLKMFLIDTDI